MGMKAIFSLGLGIVLLIAGGLTFFGYWDDISDFIGWYPDSGDLSSYAYVCNDTNSTASGLQPGTTCNKTGINDTTVTILSTELTKVTGDEGWANFTDVEVGEYEVEAEYNSSTISKENITIEKDKEATVEFNFTDYYDYG